MIPEIEMYCKVCDIREDWQLENQTQDVNVWECKGCGDIWFEPR
ncbi:hypothetical protein P59_243 [Bacillus phage P59]|nr:hypothetical protein P59_014 [Bacillus phage P59]QIW88840.1 hypothetical protein P59_243 [Bacillus phage P59]